MLWLANGFGISGGWTVNDRNDLPPRLFGFQKANKARKGARSGSDCGLPKCLRQAQKIVKSAPRPAL